MNHQSGKFVLNISMGNEAMQTGQDVAKILRLIADGLDSDLAPAGNIYDDNGNPVGKYGFKD